MSDRPVPGTVEERRAPEADAPTLEGNTLVGRIPLETESRSFGSWRERIAAGAFSQADRSSLVCTLEHDTGRVLGRFPTTLEVEERSDHIEWRCDLPNGPLGQDVRESVRRGDLNATSFRMVVAEDRWEGDLRVVERVSDWRDVALVCHSAYPQSHAAAELRHAAEPEQPAPPTNTPEEAAAMPTDSSTTGGLVIEDRAADVPAPIEDRVVNALRSVPKEESRSLTLTSADPITPPELNSFVWDRVRPLSVAIASGMRRVSTEKKEISWPAITADMTAAWTAEAATITASDPTFGTVTATPHKLASRVVLSNEVWDDSEPAALDVLVGHISRVLALKLDLGVFEGSGSGAEIRGLKNTSGIGTVSMGANGATPTNLDPFADAIATLEGASIPGPYVCVMAPRTWATLRKIKETTDSVRPLLADPPALDAPRSILGVPVFLTSQLSVTETQGTATSSTSSAYIYSVHPSVAPVIVDRKGVDSGEIAADRSRLFDSDQSEIRGIIRADLVVGHPEAVVRIVGIKP